MRIPSALSVRKHRLLRNAVICFFIGLTGVVLGFISERYSLKLLGEAAFIAVLLAVLGGGLFLVLGFANRSKDNRNGKDDR